MLLYFVFLLQIGASVPDNTGLGVPVDADGLLGMGEGYDGLGVLDGVGLQVLVDTRVDACVGAGGRVASWLARRLARPSQRVSWVIN